MQSQCSSPLPSPPPSPPLKPLGCGLRALHSPCRDFTGQDLALLGIWDWGEGGKGLVSGFL